MDKNSFQKTERLDFAFWHEKNGLLKHLATTPGRDVQNLGEITPLEPSSPEVLLCTPQMSAFQHPQNPLSRETYPHYLDQSFFPQKMNKVT